MTSSTNEPDDTGQAPRETPEVGLIPDEDLPEDVRPGEDNPLAEDPESAGDTTGGPLGGGAAPDADAFPGGPG